MTLLDVMEISELKGIDAYKEFIKAMEPLHESIDRDVLAHYITVECGAMTPIFQDVYSYWKNHYMWFRANCENFNHLRETELYNYSPLHNYDMDENTDTKGKTHSEGLQEVEGETTKDSTSSENIDYRSKENEKYGGKDTLVHGYNSQIIDNGGGTTHNDNIRDLTTTSSVLAFTENKVSAYNEDLYQPDRTEQTVTNSVENVKGKVTDDGNYSDNNTRDHKGDDTDTTTFGKTKETVISDDNTSKSGTEYVEGTSQETTKDSKDGTTEGNEKRKAFGNTGIYSKQQLIEQERSLAKFNLYEYITRKYRTDNMYAIY